MLIFAFCLTVPFNLCVINHAANQLILLHYLTWYSKRGRDMNKNSDLGVFLQKPWLNFKCCKSRGKTKTFSL
jgi:hypothetical protein